MAGRTRVFAEGWRARCHEALRRHFCARWYGPRATRRLLCAVTFAACLTSANGYSLRTVGTGRDCNGEPWSSSTACQIFSQQGIPAVTVGLFDKEGNQCCGERITSVEIALLRAASGTAESVLMDGFLVRESSASTEEGATMVLEFSGLRTRNAEAGLFNLTFSAFYQDALLEYQMPLRILPDELSLQSSLLDRQKFLVHDLLPPFTLEMRGRNTTITGDTGVRVRARLFKKDMSDITGLALYGTTSGAFDSGGRAVFADLRAQRTAGSFFRLAFFVEGSEKRCVGGVKTVTCSIWEEHRGPLGGLGGYWIETLSSPFTLLPDRLVFSAEILPLENNIRVDASLPLYTVSLYDSQFTDRILDGVVADDGLSLSVSLVSQSEAYPLSPSNIEGETTVLIESGKVIFKNLIIRSTSGPAYRLKFSPSWNSMNSLCGRDPVCLGTCCVYTPSFPIYPYAMRMSPAVVPDFVIGDDLGNFTIEFIDYQGVRLSGVGRNFGLGVSPAVLHRAAEVRGKLVGERVAVEVNGGQSTFASLSVRNLAGQKMSLRFEESASGLKVQTDSFAIYPFALNLYAPVESSVAGQPIPLDIQMLDDNGQVLSSIRAGDSFLVRAEAFKMTNGSWIACSCISYKDALVDSGIATFTKLSILAIGSFKLNFSLPRGSFSSLSLLTPEFEVVPAAITVTNSSLETVYTMGDVLGNVTIALSDFHGNDLQDVDKAYDNVVVSVRVVVGSQILEHQLTGKTSRVIEMGSAVFSGLAAPSLTGNGFRLQFLLHDRKVDLYLLANTDGFSLQPSGLLLNDTRPHGLSGMPLPALTVSLVNSNGSFVPQETLHDSRRATMISCSLLTTKYIGCSRHRPLNMAPSNWSECMHHAATAGASFFYVGLDPLGVSLCGYSGSFHQGCAGDTCWHNVPLNTTECESAGSACAQVEEVSEGEVCNATYGFRFFSLQNQTDLLRGKLHSVALGGQAIFNDLKILGFYGKAACMLLFSEAGGTQLVATDVFDLEPVRLVLRPGQVPTVLEQPVFTNLTVALTDLNGGDLTPFRYMLYRYTIVIALMHHGSELPSFHLSGQTEVYKENKVSVGFDLFNVGGKNLAIRFSTKGSRASLVTTTSLFSLFPSSLVIQSTELGGEEGSVLAAVTVSCRDDRGLITSGLSAPDSMYIEVDIYHNQTILEVCASSSSRACVQGTFRLIVHNGLVTFSDLMIVGTVGRNFQYRFTLQGRSNLMVRSHYFVVYPGSLAISGGQIVFDRMVSMNQAIGVYDLSFQTKYGNEGLNGIQEIDQFNITVSLFKDGRDFSAFLSGQCSLRPSYQAANGIHASFTDLVIRVAGAGMTLRFAFSDPHVASSVTASTGSFNVVPYALRVEETCYNRNDKSSSGTVNSVASGIAGISCLGGQPSVPSELGQFGFLTGYYYYKSNRYVGPVLRGVRGRARMPPITIAATDLYASTQTTIEGTDEYRIAVQLFVEQLDRTPYLSGNTSALIVNGTARFQDLIIEPFAECEASPCLAMLRFVFEGALCSQVWCANISIEVRPVLVPTPADLGSHPLFPATQHVLGSMILEGMSLSDFRSSEESQQELFKEAVASAANVAYHNAHDVQIINISGTGPRRLLSTEFVTVDFRFLAKTYAAATAIMSTVADALREPKSFETLHGCSEEYRSKYPICNTSVNLKEPLLRQVLSEVRDNRSSIPNFIPSGSRSSSCAKSNTCVYANITSFTGWKLKVEASAEDTIFYAMDSCPEATKWCSVSGSILSDKVINTSRSCIDCTEGRFVAPIEVIGVEPTRTLIPVGLSVLEENNPDTKDPKGYILNIARIRRHVATMPRFLTARARSYREGKREGFLSSSTFALPMQAQTPYLLRQINRQFAPGVCNGSWIIYQKNETSPVVSQASSCWDLHRLVYSDDTSICNSAVAVPCLTPRNKWICTAGSLSQTIEGDGVYDGSVHKDSGPTILTEEYIPGQGHITVESLSEIGFTNHGPLLTKRNVRVGENGKPGTSYPPLVVFEVDQASSRLLVKHTTDTVGCAKGSAVSLAEECSVGIITFTVTANFETSSFGTRIYYTLDGSEPSALSPAIGNRGSISFVPPKSLRAVAAGDGFINSFPLDVEFRALCGACSAGYYNAADGKAELLRCVSCPFSRSSRWASCKIEDCVCAPGFEEDRSMPSKANYSDPQMECKACPANHYKTDLGPTPCLQCAGNASLPSGSAHLRACMCNAGYEGDGFSECTACEPGYYKSSASTSACLQCGKGNFTNARTAASSCMVCPAGTYNQNEGVTFCNTCPDGTSSTPGSTSAADCKCTHISSCLTCPAGKYGLLIQDREVTTVGSDAYWKTGSSFEPRFISMLNPLPDIAIVTDYGGRQVVSLNLSKGPEEPLLYMHSCASWAFKPCGRCQGKCASDSDCASGLKCFQRRFTESVPGCSTQGLRNGVGYCYDPNLNPSTSVLSMPGGTYPWGATASPDGSMILVAGGDHVVWKLDRMSGNVSVFAGDGTQGSIDGSTASSRFDGPRSIVHHPGGNVVYIAENENVGRIRKIDIAANKVTTIYQGSVNQMAITRNGDTIVFTTGTQIKAMDLKTYSVWEVAGKATAGSTDGVGSTASFNQPQGIAIDLDGKTAFVADSLNDRIRGVHLDSKKVITLAGWYKGFLDGYGTDARFYNPQGIAISLDGSTLLIADQFYKRIRALRLGICATCPENSVSQQGSLSCACNDGYAGLGTIKDPCMRCPSGTYKSANYSDSFERAIVRACTVCPLNTSSPAGSVSKYDCACSPGFTGPNGGPCSACPVGWFKNAQGTEACTTCTEGSFLKPRGEVEHFAGWKLNGPNVLGYPKVVAGGTYAQDGSAATATFYAPKYIAVTPDGAQLFVLETKPTTIRSIDLASGEVSTFVKPTYSFQQNGGLEVNVDFALCWAFSYPCPMTITSDGSSLLVGYHRSLSRIDVSSGQIYNLMYDTTVFVTALAISPDGDTLYFFDKTSWSLMSLDVASGEKNRLGVPNHSPGPSNGPLAVASFSQTVNAMVVTPDGNTILVADGGYHLIRSVDLLTGQVSTVAGGGTAGGTLMDGTGTAARFYYPSALSLAPSGKTVYVTDQFFTKGYPSSSCAVRRVDLVSGTVSTLAGGQPEGFLDGAGTSASFGLIYGVAVTPDERTVLVSDQTNRRIRAVSVIAQCESCPSHSTSSSGMTSCLCDAGYTGLGTTSSPCYPCPAGTFKETTGSEPCTACPPNSFSEEIGAISSTTCVALCNPGYAGPVGGPCDECAADFYSASSTASSTACRPCFSGSSSPPGSSSLDQCTCPIGEYAEVSGAWISGDPYSAAITDGAATSAGFKRSSGRSAHSCIAINRNGDLAYALTASTGGKIRVIDLATGSVSTLPQQTSEPLKIADSNDGSTDRECGLALTDDDSTLLVSSSAYHVIQRVSVSTGQSSFLAGCTAGLAGAWGTCGGSNIPGFADGSAQADPPQYSGVRFYTPTDVAVTPDGATAIVADMNNHRVRSIDLASQEVSTLAGNGKGAIWYGYVDGDASSAQFHLPRKVRVSPDGKRVFVLERVNSGTMRYNHIRVIDMVTRKVSLLAGCVTSCAAVPTDGIGTEATFNMPLFMDISRDGTRLIVLDYDDFVASRRGTVRSVNTTSGQVTTLLSSDAFRMPIPIGASDNVVVSLSEPSGIALAPDGNSILVFSRDVSILLNISLQVCTKCPRGTYSSLTGATACISCPENTYSDSEGATSVSTCVPCPAGTSAPVGSSGCLCNAGFSGPIGGPCTMCGASFYSQSSYSYVEQIRTQTGVSCVPCQPTTSSPQGSDDPSDCECSAGKYAVRRAVDSFAGLTVSVAAYGGILVTKDGGKLLMADYSDNKVHLIDMASGNMSTLAEGIKGASGMAMSPDGDSVVVASRLDHRIRLIEVASGTVSILAGGTCGYVDGVGTLAKFCYPNSLAIAPDDGTIFVMDRFGVPKIRQIDFTSRLVTTLALRDVSGLFSIYSYADSIAVMPDGSALVVADYARHLIWMVDRSSLLSRRLVGGGSWQESDGIGTNAGVYYPKNVAVTPDGATIVFTSNNKHSIRFIDVASSVVSTPLSPLGVGAGFQDGYGTEVRFSTPQFLTVAPDGSTVFVLDAGNNKIRTISLVKCTCRGDDTCVSNGLSYANDGQCDEARYDGCADNSVCSAGTDATDCSKCAISCEA